MPTPADAPLRKVTLNLYEEDCALFETTWGFGWTSNVRNVVHEYANRIQHSYPVRTLSDLGDHSD